MANKIIFKLYEENGGYKCRVTPAEIKFLFGIVAADLDTINQILKQEKTGYYITK